MDSCLLGSVFAVEVSADGDREVVHVHEKVLMSMPFFEAQADRWRKGGDSTLYLTLPGGVSCACFRMVLEALYFRACRGVSQHADTPTILRMAQLASMLGCEDLEGGLRDSIWSATRNAEDVDAVLQFCETIEVPGALRELAERMALQKGVRPEQRRNEVASLELAVAAAVDDNSGLQMEVVGNLLKKRSRSGGACVDEVGRLILHGLKSAMDVGGAYKPGVRPLAHIAAQFVKRHPDWFAQVARATLLGSADGPWFWAANWVEKGCVLSELFLETFQVGAAHVKGERLNPDDFTKVCADALAQAPEMVASLGPDARRALGRAVGQLGPQVQCDLVGIVKRLPADSVVTLISESFIQELCMEARTAFSDHIVALALPLVRGAVTLAVLSSFGEADRRNISYKLLPQLVTLAEELKVAVLQNLDHYERVDDF